MNPRKTLIWAVCLLISAGSTLAQVNVPIRVEANPELTPGYIEQSQDFTLDFYMTQNSGATCLGFSMTYALHSPDGTVQNITHRNIGGNTTQIPDGSILLLNGFQNAAQFGDSIFWNAANTLVLNSWDGILPDTFNYTTIALPLTPPMPGWPSEGEEKLHMQLGLNISDSGLFCIDSISHANPTYDWLWLSAQVPAFNGPYCWEIVTESSPDDQSNVPIRVEANPELAPGYIEQYQDFTLDFYMTQNSGATCLGFSMTYALHSPDGTVQNITHRNIGGNTAQIPDGSILLLNGFQNAAQYGDSVFWNAANTLVLNSWDGVLPDTFNYTTIALPLMPPMPGWPSEGEEKLHIQVGLNISESGMFCIDSISHANPTYDWLWLSPQIPSFNGPYCWTVAMELPPDNDPPEFSPVSPQETTEMLLLEFTVSADDPDNVTPDLSASGLPADALFDDNNDGTGLFSWQTDNFDAGPYEVIFYAHDAVDPELFDSIVVSILVLDSNLAPNYVIPPDQEATVNEGDTLRYIINAFDDDLTTPLIVARESECPLAENMVFVDSGNGVGVLTFTPDYTQGGDPLKPYYVCWDIIDSEDAELITSTATVQLTVVNVNIAPDLLPIDDQAISEGDTLILDLLAQTIDGDPLTFDFQPPLDNTSITSINDSTGRFRFTPDYTQAGTYPLTVTVTDGDLTDQESFTLEVTDVNPAPEFLPIDPVVAMETQLVEFTVTAVDPDGSIPMINVMGTLPDDAAFVDNTDGTGSFTWQTDEFDADVYQLGFKATDATDPELYDTLSVTVTVYDQNANLVALRPDTHRVIDAQIIHPVTDTIYLGEIDHRPIADIDPATLVINGAISPLAWTTLDSFPGFFTEVLQVLIPTRGFVLGYGVQFDTTMQPFTITGEFTDDTPLSVEGEFIMIGHISGDVNSDGEVNLLDITYLIETVYLQGPDALPYAEVGDVTQDGEVNLLDILYIIRKVYGTNL